MPASRKPHNSKACLIQPIFIGIVIEKRSRPIAILNERWKRCLGGKPIVNGSQSKTAADDFRNGFFHVAHIGVFIVGNPSAAVNKNYQRELAVRICWQIKV